MRATHVMGLLAIVVFAALVIGSAASAEALIEFGTYVGDGTSPRSITVSGFTPEMVWLFAATDLPAGSGQEWWADTLRTGTFLAGSHQAMPCVGCTGITTLVSNGFTVGTGPCGSGCGGNATGVTFLWIAFTQDSDVAFGSYTGDGDTVGYRLISVGFQPDFLFLVGNNSNALKTRNMLSEAIPSPGGAGWFALANASGTSHSAICFNLGVLDRGVFWNASGFNVCPEKASGGFNASGQSYHWIALKENHAAGIWWGTYVGTGVDDQTVSVTSSPDAKWVLCAASNLTDGLLRPPMTRNITFASTLSRHFGAGDAVSSPLASNGLKAFTDAALTLGTSANCNESGTSYDALVLAPPLSVACGPSHPEACFFRVRKP